MAVESSCMTFIKYREIFPRRVHKWMKMSEDWYTVPFLQAIASQEVKWAAIKENMSLA